jgi:Zn-dependent membrane protease YugP
MFLSFHYLIFMIPAAVLAGLATLYTKSTFNKYSRFAASSRITGAEAAYRLLQSQGVHDVRIEPVRGFLSDHYDPTSRTLRLSPDVYRSPSLSAIGVACHEAGHALQHAGHYAPLAIRSSLVPITQFGSSASYFLLLGGFFLGLPGLIKLAVIAFCLVVAFALITLPVEWNATARAKRLMVSAGIVNREEAAHAGIVLNAAFLTYVASAFTALWTLFYYLLMSGMLGGRDE